jgi:hypothetical protein
MNIETKSEQNYLLGLEAISSAAEKCNLKFNDLVHVNKDIIDVAMFLDISASQAVFFACIALLSFQRTVTFDGLGKHLGCSALSLVAQMNNIDALEKKGYIQKKIKNRDRKYSYNDLGYNVPYNVIEALRKNDRTMLSEIIKFDLPKFLKQISDIVDERYNQNLSTEQVLNETEFLIRENISLPFVSFVDRELSDMVSKCTMFCMSYFRLKGQFTVCIESFANSLFDDLGYQLEFSQLVASGSHELIVKGMLKLVCSEFDGERAVMVDHKAAKCIYQDYPNLLMPEQDNPGLIRARSIRPRKLYYDNELTDQIVSIEKILRPAKFRSYLKALENNGLSRGVTAILYGAPGTGKTETVYQQARQTGRNTSMVDLSQTKSKWFGDSEKRARQIFCDYAALLENSEREPILFINEADGLFTRRLESGGKSSAADQAINTMQNILLQEMESFEGILVAATNLAGNLDKAFERRFTFKIGFPKPDLSVRSRIWKSRVPELTDAEAEMLGRSFEITGDDIDLHVRQLIFARVLNRGTSIYGTLAESCSRDQGFSGKRKIGF